MTAVSIAQGRRFWTPAEYALLDSRYPHERTDVIAKDLGRALKSVYAMASLRGLHNPSDKSNDRPAGMRTSFDTWRGPLGWAQIGAGIMSLRIACLLLVMPTYKPGDQAPEGYLQWQEWAEAQHKAGLRQKPCGVCGKWKYPQQIHGERKWTARDRRGRPVEQTSVVCNDCATPKEPLSHERHQRYAV